MEDWQHGGFGLYIHWPFCTSKCPYCDFNSHVSATVDQKHWQRAFLSEIDRSALETPGRVLNSVFFGGGTPSLMDPDLVAAIIDRIRSRWPMVNDPEITLEANPGSIEAGRFRAYRAAGVNRVSMGMQAMNDDDLRMLGRKHTVAEALTAFEIARSCFDRVSFDLIYARQNQNLASWRTELGQALTLAVDHLSLYQLTIEDGTTFGDRLSRGGLKGLPTDDLAADMYETTQELCNNAGFPAYEVSNMAKSGAESQHNLIYWRGGDYLGIGPGAHGRVTLAGNRWSTEAPKSPALWLAMVDSGMAGELPRSTLSPTDHGLEYLLMSLRLVEGMKISRYEAISGQPLNQLRLNQLIDLNMVVLTDDRLCVTAAGRLVLNAIIRTLAAG